MAESKEIFANYRARACLISLFTRVAFTTLIFSAAACGQQSEVLHSDLAVNVHCNGKDPILLEINFENFLRESGFRVLNVERIRDTRRLTPSKRTYIIGLDAQRRIIEFRNFDGGLYSLVLNTTPPTHHADRLEAAILNFFQKTMRCGESPQVNKGQNNLEAVAFYEREVARVKGLFQEAGDYSQLK